MTSLFTVFKHQALLQNSCFVCVSHCFKMGSYSEFLSTTNHQSIMSELCCDLDIKCTPIFSLRYMFIHRKYCHMKRLGLPIILRRDINITCISRILVSLFKSVDYKTPLFFSCQSIPQSAHKKFMKTETLLFPFLGLISVGLLSPVYQHNQLIS